MAQSEAPHVRGFLFADLRGFTQFVEKHGDRAAAELLKAYRAIVRAAVANFSGAEIRTEGDGDPLLSACLLANGHRLD